jgi:hypothetical protein
MSDNCSRGRNRIEYGSMRSITSCEHDIFKVGGKILGGSSWNPSTSRLRLFKPSSKFRFIVTLCGVWIPKGKRGRPVALRTLVNVFAQDEEVWGCISREVTI